ncbi:unnamed protein product, partial [Rotaria magnacalcarata]
FNTSKECTFGNAIEKISHSITRQQLI